jgi:hypothetical protein
MNKPSKSATIKSVSAKSVLAFAKKGAGKPKGGKKSC